MSYVIVGPKETLDKAKYSECTITWKVSSALITSALITSALITSALITSALIILITCLIITLISSALPSKPSRQPRGKLEASLGSAEAHSRLEAHARLAEMLRRTRC